MDVKAYLQRVNLTDTAPPSLSALRELHRHHVHSVPTESLSIHSGEKIILDIPWIYNKIVVRRRGGFCFENNGLFLWVLQQLGYKTRVLSARVRNIFTGIYGPPFDHIVLTVELEGRRWLCDVGYGEGIVEPFPLEDGWEEEQDSGVYRLRVEGDEWYMERKEEEIWRSVFKFTLEERKFEDFQEMCEYHQTSPSSVFVRKSFCSLQLPHARLTYMGHRLISTQYTKGGGSVKTTQELTEEEIPSLLRDKFGIVLNGKLIPKDENIVIPNQLQSACSSNPDLNTYLQRIGLPDFIAPSMQPSLSQLRTLHRHHVLSIPFESLSIHSGEKIHLDICWIYEKIVLRKRGGFCFENNGLFLWVLQQLGYQTQVLSGRVRNISFGTYGPPFEHIVLTVELEGRRWLCDVGYGESIVEPFPLEDGWEEEQDSGVYRLRVEGDEWYMERKEEDIWRSLFKFTLEERKFEDFQEMCEYHQTSPSSIFVQKSFCSLQLPRARLTYMGHRLISTQYTKGGGSVKTTQELTEEEIPSLLSDKFGIVLRGKFIPKDGNIVIPNQLQSGCSSKPDLNTYLQRIGLPDFIAPSMQPSLSQLRTLHRHHVLSIPFESLSIHSGEKIHLDICWIYEKIVIRKRGGFCFENNGLHFWVLQQLGYEPRIISARVRDVVSGLFTPPLSHMLITVELEGKRWLCDVGFGEAIIEPFLLEDGHEEEQDIGVFRLRVEGDEWYMERKEKEESWRSLYKFTLEERIFEDFRDMCENLQTEPSSFFVCKSFCTLPLPHRRLTYIGHRLISTEYTKGGGSVKTTQELNEEEIPSVLRDKFGIVLSGKLIPKDD